MGVTITPFEINYTKKQEATSCNYSEPVVARWLLTSLLKPSEFSKLGKIWALLFFLSLTHNSLQYLFFGIFAM